MSMTQPPDERVGSVDTQARGAAQVRGQATDTFGARWARMRETKPSYMTTELWLMLAGVAGLFITYNVVDETTLTLWRTCLLATILGAAYVVSRGLAKSNAPDEEHIPQHARTEPAERYAERR
ncbi:MAG TPA: hypothetical protein VF183_09535 [Acidimicrobiales bacterium]